MVELPSYAAMAPTLILGVTALLVLTYDMIDPDSRNRRVLAGLSLAGTVVALGTAVWFLTAGVGRPLQKGGNGVFYLFGDQLIVDTMSLFFAVVFTSVTALVVAASYDYLEDHSYQAEFYSLVLLAATGMTLMASANSLATVLVSLELSSLPSYALVAFLKENRGSVEAGLKYFVVGAVSSAVFIYGISLVYGATGSLQLAAIADALSGTVQAGVLGFGVLMVLAGFLFKTASVPFHFWAPEAYEGAPAPISGFLSSASKAAGFAVMFRVFTVAFPLETVATQSMGIDWVLIAGIVAVLTMTIGNFAAATQEKVKRMLAYSSVGHAGYALIGLAALTAGGGRNVLGASMMHLLVYGFMNTGAFLFVAMVEHWGLGRTFEDLNGLGARAPMASVAMTVFMFSLAGLPPFAGFFSKYFLFAGAVENGFWWLAAVGAVNSALSLYYYSRVVKALWFDDPVEDYSVESRPLGIYAAVIAAAVLTVALLPAFGIVSKGAIDAAATLL